MQKVLSIQYLRAAAALAVVVFHATNKTRFPFAIGVAGVDLFFVISGFIMWEVTRRKLTPTEFGARRIMRIVPMYWMATILFVLLAAISRDLSPASDVSTWHVVKSLLFIPYYDGSGHVFPVVVPGWTLLYEMFFYLLFSLTLFVRRVMQAWLLAAGLILLVALGYWLHPQAAYLTIYTNPLLLEFLAGVLISIGSGWLARLPRAATMGAAVTAVILLVASSMIQAAAEENRVLFWGAPAALLVAAAVGFERAGSIVRLPWAERLGDASYSTYLFHGLAIRGAWLVPGIPTWSRTVVAIVLAVGLGLMLYRYVERPLISFSHRLKFARVSAATGAGELPGRGNA